MRRMVSAGKKSAKAICRLDRRSRRRQAVRFVVCVENSGYPASLNCTKSTELSPIKTPRGRATFASLTRVVRTLCTRRNGSLP
jgi:hypothetical protein